MNVTELRDELTHRITLHVNDDFGIEKSWKKLTEILSENIDDAIRFINNTCTDEELFWLSEVFEDIAEKTQSKELIQALRNRLAKVTPETYCQQNFQTELMQKRVDYDKYIRSVGNEIDYAEGRIEE